MTTEQLKNKFIFQSGRFTHNGEKFILDVEATKALNEKRGVPMNASVIWLVGNSPDGSSQVEEISFLCGKLREPIPGVKEPDLQINDVEIVEEQTDLTPTTVEDVDKETGTSEEDSTGSPETNEPEVKPKIDNVKAKEAKKKPAAKKIKPAAKKKSPVKKVVKK